MPPVPRQRSCAMPDLRRIWKDPNGIGLFRKQAIRNLHRLLWRETYPLQNLWWRRLPVTNGLVSDLSFG